MSGDRIRVRIARSRDSISSHCGSVATMSLTIASNSVSRFITTSSGALYSCAQVVIFSCTDLRVNI